MGVQAMSPNLKCSSQSSRSTRFFFFFIEREVLVLVWPASLLESGGRCLALGFPGLCEAGPVEPDK